MDALQLFARYGRWRLLLLGPRDATDGARELQFPHAIGVREVAVLPTDIRTDVTGCQLVPSFGTAWAALAVTSPPRFGAWPFATVVLDVQVAVKVEKLPSTLGAD